MQVDYNIWPLRMLLNYNILAIIGTFYYDVDLNETATAIMYLDKVLLGILNLAATPSVMLPYLVVQTT